MEQKSSTKANNKMVVRCSICELRIMDIQGRILFCGSDVAKALAYTNPLKALRDHCKGITKRSARSSFAFDRSLYEYPQFWEWVAL